MKKIEQIKRHRELLLQQLERKIAQTPKRYQAEAERAGRWDIQAKYEMLTDHALHDGQAGPFYLQRPAITKLVLDSWHFLHHTQAVFLCAVCVMGNHVHVVLSNGLGKEDTCFGTIVKRHKTYTSLRANQLLNRTGKPFWEKTYFDRRVRHGKFVRVMWYVLNNPVKSGLVSRWWDWPGTWVHPEYLPMFTGVAA